VAGSNKPSGHDLERRRALPDGPPHGHLALSVDKMASQFDAGRLAEALEGLQALTQDDPFDESDESGTVASWLW